MMKKTLSVLMLFSLLLSFSACQKPEYKEITCDAIIKAYEDAGYFVTHGEHRDAADSSQLCYIKAYVSEEPDSDYIYFITCFTEEQAEEVRKTEKYNLFIWLYAAISGEGRWLKTGTYGTIEYSYYNPQFIKPFEELIS